MNKITEVEVAGYFTITILRNAQEHWSSISNELNQLFPNNKPISDDQYACFEFALAVIATQMQALPNLLSKEQSSRIRERILEGISSPELGSYPREAIAEYQEAWDMSLDQAEPAYFGIASVLFDKLECEDTTKMGEVVFKSPLLLMALSEKIICFDGAWWKNAIEKNEVVPS